MEHLHELVEFAAQAARESEAGAAALHDIRLAVSEVGSNVVEHDMETSVERRGDVSIVHVTGSVDGMTADDLQLVFTGELDADHHKLVADYSTLDYTSSAGLRVLLATMKRARSFGGDLLVAGPPPDVRKVLELSGFTSFLKLYETADDAVASFG